MSNDRQLIFAHRGGDKEALEQGFAIAENSRAAFNQALQSAIDGIETDVQLSLDEVPVLWHDWFLDKLGHPGLRIDDFTFEQLKKIDFAGAGISGAAPESVISLQEFIDSYRERCRLNIEIKSHDGESTPRQQSKLRQTLSILNPFFKQDVFISSFSQACLRFAHEQDEYAPLFYLLRDDFKQTDLTTLLKTEPFLTGFGLPISRLDNAIVDLLHDSGKIIATYTCNSKEELLKAFNLETDMIITDFPSMALRLREDNQDT
jgi:glycerophosphoryl diester phosphodiesterase